MGLINRVRAAYRAATGPNEITTSEDLDAWIRRGGAETASGVPVTYSNAQGLAAVAISVRVLSSAVAHLPLQVLERNGNRREPARSNPVYRLLHDRPNPWQTSFQWRKLAMRDLLLRGDAFSLKVPGARGTQALIRMHPDRVQVTQDPRNYDVTYTYTRPDGAQVIFPRDRVFHVWSDSDDGIQGLNPIKLYRETIGDSLAIREHGSRFYANGAKPLGLIEMDGEMGREARKDFREDFESSYAGGANAYRTLLLPQGVSYKPVSITMEDAQWIQSRKSSAREIYGIFGIPPHKAGDLADATFSNIEHENIDFVISSLMPWLVCWEQAINRDLLDDSPELYAKFREGALLRGDAKSRAEALQIERRNGVINANEWRELTDRNPRTDTGGDVYIIEGNMQPNDGQEAQRMRDSGSSEPTGEPT